MKMKKGTRGGRRGDAVLHLRKEELSGRRGLCDSDKGK